MTEDPRAQLSLSLLEAGVGVVLVFAVVSGFALGGVQTHTDRARLDRHARDAATVLSDDAGAVAVSDLTSSRGAFERHRAAFRRRAERALPANLLYRVETPRGAVGYPVPDGRTVGVARVRTADGPVTVRVWYP